MKRNIAYLLIIWLIIFHSALNVRGQDSMDKITRVGFFLFEASLEPESVELLKKQVFPLDSPSVLKAFFNEKIEAGQPQEIESELKIKFPLSYLRLIKKGTYILTWEAKKRVAEEKKAKEGSSESISDSRPGFFCDDSKLFPKPMSSFFTRDGLRHRILLKSPDPSLPPGPELMVEVFKSQVPAERETLAGEPEPSVFEFSGLITVPESGAHLIGLLGPQDTAYFLCFTARGIREDYDVQSLFPKLIHKVNPHYPEEALRQRIQGKVILRVTTDTDGRVYDVKVVESSHPLLTEAAMDAVKKWVYKVPVLDGKRFQMDFTVTLTFSLSR